MRNVFNDTFKSVDNGLLKIMSKMGISVLSAYRGGCNFETVGLSRAIVAEYFPGMISRISGIGIFGIEKKIRTSQKSFSKKHQFFQLVVFTNIEKMVKTPISRSANSYVATCSGYKSYETYKKYAQGIYNLPTINLRDLLAFKNLGKAN